MTRDILWIVIGILLGLICYFYDGSTVLAQSQRTTCYDSGNTRICDTHDSMGNVISKSRCYQSGRDTRCETQSFAGSSSSSNTTILPVPRRP